MQSLFVCFVSCRIGAPVSIHQALCIVALCILNYCTMHPVSFHLAPYNVAAHMRAAHILDADSNKQAGTLRLLVQSRKLGIGF